MVAVMPKKLDELIELAASTKNSVERGRIAAKARKLVKPKAKPTGRPTKYAESKAVEVCREIANGKTLTSICRDMGLSLDCVYGWLKDYPDFAERYQSARESMARSLLDELLDETRTAEPDRALLLKVKSNVLTWAIARFNPKEFSDSRKIQLQGEISVKHVHELSESQRQRIAESWLMSRQAVDDSAGRIIEHEPATDIPALADDESETRVIPKRRRAVLPAKPAASSDDSGRWTGGRRGGV